MWALKLSTAKSTLNISDKQTSTLGAFIGHFIWYTSSTMQISDRPIIWQWVSVLSHQPGRPAEVQNQHQNGCLVWNEAFFFLEKKKLSMNRNWVVHQKQLCWKLVLPLCATTSKMYAIKIRQNIWSWIENKHCDWLTGTWTELSRSTLVCVMGFVGSDSWL